MTTLGLALIHYLSNSAWSPTSRLWEICLKDFPIDLTIPPHNVSNRMFCLHYSLSSPLTTPQVIYKHYMRALSQWPKDALRPDCRFEDVMRKQIEQKFNPPKAAEGAKPVAAIPIDEKAEMDQVNALFSLLGNRYTKRVSGMLLPSQLLC